MTESSESGEGHRDVGWVLQAVATPELVRDALRHDRGLVKLLGANEAFLEGFFCSPLPLAVLLDASERLGKEDLDLDGLAARIKGSDGAAVSGHSPSTRLARELRALLVDKEKSRLVFRRHPELIASLASNEGFAEALAGYDRVWEALLKKGIERFSKDVAVQERIGTALGKIIRFTYGGTLVDPDPGWEPPLELINAAKNGDLHKLNQELTTNPRINPDHGWQVNGRGWTALMYAAAGGHLGCVRELLTDRRINPNRSSKADGMDRTALMCAAEFGRENCIRALLEDTRLDPTRADERGWTARETARRCGNTACELVLEKAEREWSRARHQSGRK